MFNRMGVCLSCLLYADFRNSSGSSAFSFLSADETHELKQVDSRLFLPFLNLLKTANSDVRKGVVEFNIK